jgi:hypothetical protein
MSSATTRPVAVLPCLIGAALWTGATALLCEDALRSGHFSINGAPQPLLTAGTVCAAVLCHHRLAGWRLISGAAFLLLALLGSAATIYGTLSRTAAARDLSQADAMAANRTLAERDAALQAAKVAAAAECKVMGPRCQQWQGRVDALTREMAPMRAVAIDPRADAIGNLAQLLGGDGARVRAIVGVLDPVVLPLFLEAGCILFFAAAFPRRRRAIARKDEATVVRVYTRDEALADFRTMRQAGAQSLLAARWGRDEATVSRWLQSWAQSGQVQRARDGRHMTVRALPRPASRTVRTV